MKRVAQFPGFQKCLIWCNQCEDKCVKNRRLPSASKDVLLPSFSTQNIYLRKVLIVSTFSFLWTVRKSFGGLARPLVSCTTQQHLLKALGPSLWNVIMKEESTRLLVSVEGRSLTSEGHLAQSCKTTYSHKGMSSLFSLGWRQLVNTSAHPNYQVNPGWAVRPSDWRTGDCLSWELARSGLCLRGYAFVSVFAVCKQVVRDSYPTWFNVFSVTTLFLCYLRGENFWVWKSVCF